MGSHVAKNPAPVQDVQAAETPAATVGGWTLVFFAFVPLMMAVNGDGIGYGIAGAVMLATAAVLIVLGRRASHP